MNKQELINHLNKLRKTNKNVWVFWNGVFDGQEINYKSFNTWVQILDIGNNGKTWRYSSPMELSIKDYLTFLNASI